LLIQTSAGLAAAGVSATACWICSTGFLIDLGVLLSNSRGSSAVTLLGGYEFNAAVVMPMVIPVDKRGTHMHASSLLINGRLG
jgi:hypothetical protein